MAKRKRQRKLHRSTPKSKKHQLTKAQLALKHKREQALLDLSAPRLITQKQLTLPITKLTLSPKIEPAIKLVYGELYTLFNISGKIQLNHASLSKPVGLTNKQVDKIIKYLQKLHLLKIVSVRSSHVLGHIIINTGLNQSANRLNNVLSRTDYQLHLKYIKQCHEAKKAIDYLNKKTGRRFTHSKSNINDILGRIHEGYHFKDCYTVVDNMCYWWSEKRNPSMTQFLVPDTLFGRKTKFDNYLNKTRPHHNDYDKGKDAMNHEFDF